MKSGRVPDGEEVESLTSSPDDARAAGGDNCTLTGDLLHLPPDGRPRIVVAKPRSKTTCFEEY